MTVIHTRRDLPYLPMPNVSEVVISDGIAPDLLTPTAFVLAFTTDGRIAMATNRKRGLEFPGGHRDPLSGVAARDYAMIAPGYLEDVATAARRELWEEAGCRVGELRALAYHRNECLGEKPEGYRYPFPLSYQQFMVGVITGIADYNDNPECAQPVFLTREEARLGMNPQQWALAAAAWGLVLIPQDALMESPFGERG